MGVNHTLNRNAGDHILTFNGKDLREFGVHVSGEKTFTAPERDVEFISIPGRSGDLIQDNGCFLNQTVSYACGITIDFDQNFSALKAWLQQDAEYHRLTDSYHPDEYRQAAFLAAIEPEMEQYNASGRFSLEFVCKPQRFLLSGEATTRYRPASGASFQITNPTRFPSTPKITIGNGENATITINGIRITISPYKNVTHLNSITVDCEAQDCYNETTPPTNMNRYITLTDTNGDIAYEYPRLLPGNNTISVSGTVSYIDITPRWWRT